MRRTEASDGHANKECQRLSKFPEAIPDDGCGEMSQFTANGFTVLSVDLHHFTHFCITGGLGRRDTIAEGKMMLPLLLCRSI